MRLLPVCVRQVHFKNRLSFDITITVIIFYLFFLHLFELELHQWRLPPIHCYSPFHWKEHLEIAVLISFVTLISHILYVSITLIAGRKRYPLKMENFLPSEEKEVHKKNIELAFSNEDKPLCENNQVLLSIA